MTITQDQLENAQALYVRRNGDVYRVTAWWRGPVVEVTHIENGERQVFGLDGLTSQEFHPLVKAP